MAMVTRSNCYFKSYPYPYSYPSVISSLILPTSRCYSHEINQRSNFPCLSNGRRYNDLYNHDNSNSRLSVLCGYGYGYYMVHSYRHLWYSVTKASKRANGEEKYYNTKDEYTREEKRWLREEKRWLREETRWNSERDSLVRQISHLSHKIQDLELKLEGLRNRVGSSSNVLETISKIASLSIVEPYTTSISTSGSMNPNQNQIIECSEDTNKPMVMEHFKPQRTSRLSLKTGTEGEEVRALQEALMNLGFYSGEEDMEYSSFSNGTQLAVKTWQASVGGLEDGIMTAELLEKLYATQQIHKSELLVNSVQDINILKQDKANGAPSDFVTEVGEVQQTVVKKGPVDVEVSQQRVYLLGENRWEDPSRLKKGNDKHVSGAVAHGSATKCLACRGEGRILCIECDGTGEPNIEPQFLEWVEEGLKCPYCEGLGYTVCDLCDGKAVA